MSFFIRNKTSNKKKRGLDSKIAPHSKNKQIATKSKRAISDGEEILSDSDIDSDDPSSKRDVDYSSSDEEEETAQEKRIRLAKQYLSKLGEQTADDEGGDNRNAVSQKIEEDLLEQSGKLHREVADKVQLPTDENIKVLRGHQLAITCLVITHDDKYIFSASKDCSIIKWNIETGKKEHVIHGGRKGTEKKHVGHTSHILCLAISSDSKFLASGDRNKLIHLWNPEDCKLIHTFTGHRDAVSGLAFQKNTHQLFSASHDRTVKIWSVDDLAYVETLFGHQDAITAIDSLTRERAITSGGRDGSVRIWKVVEESQLVYHGHRGSIDCVALINEDHFVSGADDNSVALWGVMKKKPLVQISNAHGGEGDRVNGEQWITAVASLLSSDLIASGACDGSIRLWKCSQDYKSVNPLCVIPAVGFVNSLQFSKNGQFLVAGLGQEHKLGRWWRVKEARNVIKVIPLVNKTQ